MSPDESDLEDKELFAKARLGDQVAGEQLVKKHWRRLWRIAVRITRNRQDAEEVVQDALIKIVSTKRYKPDMGTFRAWSSQITVRQALDLLRKRGRRSEVDLDPDAIGDLRVGADVDPLLWMALEKCLKSLAQRLEEIFERVTLCGDALEVVAVDLKWQNSTIRSRVSEVETAMEECMKTQGYGH